MVILTVNEDKKPILISQQFVHTVQKTPSLPKEARAFFNTTHYVECYIRLSSHFSKKTRLTIDHHKPCFFVFLIVFRNISNCFCQEISCTICFLKLSLKKVGVPKEPPPPRVTNVKFLPHPQRPINLIFHVNSC